MRLDIKKWREINAYLINYRIVSQFGDGSFNYRKQVVLGYTFNDAMERLQTMYGQKKYLQKIQFNILDITDLGSPEGLIDLS
jgi:hypothetical protein